jgi:hypothetical protein
VPLGLVAALQGATGVGLIAFWVVFFTTDWLLPAHPPPGYLAHERAFAYPDVLMGFALLAAAVLNWNGMPLGPALSLICAGSLLFLGVIDLAYDIENGLLGGSLREVIQNAAIDFWVLLFGLFLALRFA